MEYCSQRDTCWKAYNFLNVYQYLHRAWDWSYKAKCIGFPIVMPPAPPNPHVIQPIVIYNCYSHRYTWEMAKKAENQYRGCRHHLIVKNRWLLDILIIREFAMLMSFKLPLTATRFLLSVVPAALERTTPRYHYFWKPHKAQHSDASNLAHSAADLSLEWYS